MSLEDQTVQTADQRVTVFADSQKREYSVVNWEQAPSRQHGIHRIAGKYLRRTPMTGRTQTDSVLRHLYRPPSRVSGALMVMKSRHWNPSNRLAQEMRSRHLALASLSVSGKLRLICTTENAVRGHRSTKSGLICLPKRLNDAKYNGTKVGRSLCNIQIPNYLHL